MCGCYNWFHCQSLQLIVSLFISSNLSIIHGCAIEMAIICIDYKKGIIGEVNKARSLKRKVPTHVHLEMNHYRVFGFDISYY